MSTTEPNPLLPGNPITPAPPAPQPGQTAPNPNPTATGGDVSGPPAPGQTEPGPFDSTNPPDLSGPPAPGQTGPGPFPEPAPGPSTVTAGSAPSAWASLMQTLGLTVPNATANIARSRARIDRIRR